MDLFIAATSAFCYCRFVHPAALFQMSPRDFFQAEPRHFARIRWRLEWRSCRRSHDRLHVVDPRSREDNPERAPYYLANLKGIEGLVLASIAASSFYVASLPSKTRSIPLAPRANRCLALDVFKAQRRPLKWSKASKALANPKAKSYTPERSSRIFPKRGTKTDTALPEFLLDVPAVCPASCAYVCV